MLIFATCLSFLFDYILIVTTFQVYPSIKTYCRDRDRLIVSDKFDEYLLVDAELNTTLLLDCRFCKEPNDRQPKSWYFQDRFQSSEVREVDFDMNNNESFNRIQVTYDTNLMIKYFSFQDAGIYRCHGKLGEDVDKKYNYRLEQIDTDFIQRGNLSDWESYRQINLVPITDRLAFSRMPGLILIRESGVILEAIFEWSIWGPCENCIKKVGLKTSKSQCRLRARLKDDVSTTTAIANFFDKSPLLPCRSYLLNDEFPLVSRIIRHIPDFLLQKTCKKCKKEKRKKKDKFKHKKSFTLDEGAHLALTCPESDIDTKIVWKKNDRTLKTGSKTAVFLKTKKNRKEVDMGHIWVDAFSTLYFAEVTREEAGNYTCYVNDIKMMMVKIRIKPKPHLLTEALFRHMGYLGFILFLSSFCYCAGLIAVCKNPQKYINKSYETIMEEREIRKRVKFQLDLNDDES